MGRIKDQTWWEEYKIDHDGKNKRLDMVGRIKAHWTWWEE